MSSKLQLRLEKCYSIIFKQIFPWFHKHFRSKTTRFEEIKTFCRDAKWCFNASWGFKRLKPVAASIKMIASDEILHVFHLKRKRVKCAGVWREFQSQLTSSLKLAVTQQTRGVGPMLGWCLASVVELSMLGQRIFQLFTEVIFFNAMKL